MKRKNYSIDFDEMDFLSKNFGQNGKKGEQVGASFKSGSMSGIKKSGLFSNGVSTIEKEIKNTANIISTIGNELNKQTEIAFENEMGFAKLANDIQYPTDFIKNDSKKYNSIEDIKLNKGDGRSVNDGEKAKEFRDIDESEIEEEKLKDITGEEAKEFKEIDESEIEEEKLKDITGEEAEEFKEIDDSKLKEEKLKKLKTEETNVIEDPTEDLIEQQKTLSNMQNNMTSSVDTDNIFTSSNDENKEKEEQEQQKQLNDEEENEEQMKNIYSLYQQYENQKGKAENNNEE